MKRHKVMFMLQYGTRMEKSLNGFCMVYPPQGWKFKDRLGQTLNCYAKTVPNAVSVKLVKL